MKFISDDELIRRTKDGVTPREAEIWLTDELEMILQTLRSDIAKLDPHEEPSNKNVLGCIALIQDRISFIKYCVPK